MKQLYLFSTLLFFAITVKGQTVIQLALPDQPAELTVTAGDDATINEDGQTTLSANAAGGSPTYRYLWSPSDGLSNSAIAAPDASPSDTTVYIVQATDQRLCTATDTLIVNVIHTIGTDNITTNTLHIYPNPVQDYFHINLNAPAETTTVSLMTIDGKEIWHKTLNSKDLSSTRFDTGPENSICLLKIVSGSLVLTQTLVVSQK